MIKPTIVLSQMHIRDLLRLHLGLLADAFVQSYLQ